MTTSTTPSTSNAAEPDQGGAVAGSPALSVILNAVIFGILSGAALSAIVYYRIVVGDEGAVIAFAPLVAFAWIFAGFRASKRAVSTPSGAVAGLLAAVVGATIG